MVAKNALGRIIMKKLHVYRNAEHPHAAQQPAPVSLK
jgi:large subunit ribosomal protein L13